jgi:hypothetical protein
MKIEQKLVFAPVTIVLETKEELEAIMRSLQESIALYKEKDWFNPHITERKAYVQLLTYMCNELTNNPY